MVESVAEFKKPLADFLSGIEGSKGLYELIKVQLGLDLTDDEGLKEVGLDPKTGLVFFEKEGSFSFAVGVSYPKRFMDHVRERIRILGPSNLSESADDKVRLATGPSLPDGEGFLWSVAWGVTSDNVGLVTWTGKGESAEAAWDLAADKPSSTFEKPESLNDAMLWAAGHTGGLKFDVPVPVVGNVLSQALKGGGNWELGVELEPDTLRLRASIPGGAGLGAIGPYMQTDTSSPKFAAIFPKNSSLFVRSRVLLEKAGPFLAGAALLLNSEPAYIDRLPVPPIPMLLDSLTGEIAVAVMGLDDGVQPTTILRIRNDLPRLLQAVHTAVAVEAVTEAKAKELLSSIVARAPTAGFRTSALSHAEMEGVILTKELTARRGGYKSRQEKRVYTVLRHGKILVGISGEGELQRFLDVQAGKAIALQTAATDAHMKAALIEGKDALALTLMSTRITRELADKGMPPFFLTVVNSIREIALRARVEKKHLKIVLEARQ